MAPRLANTDVENATSPCFINEASQGMSEFADINDGVYGSPCLTQDTSMVDLCLTPNSTRVRARGSGAPGDPSRALFLLGDSHAAAMVAGLGSATRDDYVLAWAATFFGGGFNGPWPSAVSCIYDGFNGVANCLQSELKP